MRPFPADWGTIVSTIAQADGLLIRRMEDSPADFEQVLRWMTDPETMRFWEGMTEHYDLARVEAEYRGHDAENTTPCIVELDGRTVGYMQFAPIGTAADYEIPEAEWEKIVRPGETAYGIDMYIGEVGCRDRGLGTRMLNLLASALFASYGADVLLIDPKTHNARAIACYRKCGFRDCCVVPQREKQDGILHDSLIMARHA